MPSPRLARPVHRLAALALPVMLGLGGCDVLRDSLGDRSGVPALDPPRVINVAVDSVRLVRTEPRTAVFFVRGGVPVPCYDVAGAATRVEGARVSVELRARSWGQVCADVNGYVGVPDLAVRVPAPGRYTVAFWRSDARPPIERVVDVP